MGWGAKRLGPTGLGRVLGPSRLQRRAPSLLQRPVSLLTSFIYACFVPSRALLKHEGDYNLTTCSRYAQKSGIRQENCQIVNGSTRAPAAVSSTVARREKTHAKNTAVDSAAVAVDQSDTFKYPKIQEGSSKQCSDSRRSTRVNCIYE